MQTKNVNKPQYLQQVEVPQHIFDIYDENLEYTLYILDMYHPGRLHPKKRFICILYFFILSVKRVDLRIMGNNIFIFSGRP